MTKWIWPNEYDQNIWTWPKNDNNEPKLVEHDWKLKKLATMTNMNGWIGPKLKE